MILEKLEKISRYHFRLEITPREKEVYVRVKSTKVYRNKKKLFKYDDVDKVELWFKDLEAQAKARKSKKAKVKTKRKKKTGSSIDYEKKAVDAFQARCRYRCAMRDNNSIHYWKCITSWKPTATNYRSRKYYKTEIYWLRQGHAGHAVSRAMKNLKFYEKNCHLQSAMENKKQWGNFPVNYREAIVDLYWEKELEKILDMEKQRKSGKRWKKMYQEDYKRIYLKYKKRLEKRKIYETNSWYFPETYLWKSKIILDK